MSGIICLFLTLPKRRVLHLPCLEAEAMLRSLLIRQAQTEELSKPSQGKSMGDRARELADYIDVLDDRIFGGVLLIGGLVAIFNPLAGAGRRIAKPRRNKAQSQASRERCPKPVSWIRNETARERDSDNY